jgi:hypothetical protein
MESNTLNKATISIDALASVSVGRFNPEEAPHEGLEGVTEGRLLFSTQN